MDAFPGRKVPDKVAARLKNKAAVSGSPYEPGHYFFIFLGLPKNGKKKGKRNGKKNGEKNGKRPNPNPMPYHTFLNWKISTATPRKILKPCRWD
jgi:hypothetical protein